MAPQAAHPAVSAAVWREVEEAHLARGVRRRLLGELYRSKIFEHEMAQPINTLDKHGRTALHYAVHRSNAEAAEALVTECANLHVRDKAGKLPVDYADPEADRPLRAFLLLKMQNF